MPELGPCVCDAGAEQLHEHSDFEPFDCGDCDCPGHRAPGTPIPAEKAAQPLGPPRLAIPAELVDFARERVTETAQHLDQTITSIRGTFTDPDDPLAVCALADTLEQTWSDHADSWVALVLAIRRLIDAPNHGGHRRPRQALEAIRRKVQR